jgi:hypothetical protein
MISKIALEKIYFSITRWIIFTSATLAIIAVVGGLVYALMLYAKSKDTTIDRKYYEIKLPEVTFEEVMEVDKNRRKEIAQIKTYVYNVIKNGSGGHGYAFGKMPKEIIAGKNAEEVSSFIANRLSSKTIPKGFSNCIDCHGLDGGGNNGKSPNLKILPIFNGQQPTVAEYVSSTEEKKVYEVPLVIKSDMDINIDHIISNINRYALKVGQDGIKKTKMKNTLYKNTRHYRDKIYKKLYLKHLRDRTNKLLVYGDSYPQEKIYAIPALDWNEFIGVFTKKFNEHIENELYKSNEVQSEQDRILRKKKSDARYADMQLLITVSSIGMALGVFLLLTLILIMIRVEKNTRKLNSEETNRGDISA